jgi:hypothetical protein
LIHVIRNAYIVLSNQSCKKILSIANMNDDDDEEVFTCID